VQHDARRAVQLLLHDERDDGLLLQLDDGHVQVRADRRRRLHHLHQWRPILLCDDRGLLCVHDLDDEIWLHMLPDDQQHAGLLRLLKPAPTNKPNPRAGASRRRPSIRRRIRPSLRHRSRLEFAPRSG